MNIENAIIKKVSFLEIETGGFSISHKIDVKTETIILYMDFMAENPGGYINISFFDEKGKRRLIQINVKKFLSPITIENATCKKEFSTHVSIDSFNLMGFKRIVADDIIDINIHQGIPGMVDHGGEATDSDPTSIFTFTASTNQILKIGVQGYDFRLF